jgi:hypothetical protein
VGRGDFSAARFWFTCRLSHFPTFRTAFSSAATKFKKRHDARMVQLRQRLGFAGEAFGERRIVADAGRQNFQRHDAIELFLARFVNRAHAAFADEFEDFQLRKQRGQFRH